MTCVRCGEDGWIVYCATCKRLLTTSYWCSGNNHYCSEGCATLMFRRGLCKVVVEDPDIKVRAE